MIVLNLERLKFVECQELNMEFMKVVMRLNGGDGRREEVETHFIFFCGREEMSWLKLKGSNIQIKRTFVEFRCITPWQLFMKRWCHPRQILTAYPGRF